MTAASLEQMEPAHPRATRPPLCGWARALRPVVQTLLFIPVVRCLCRPLTVRGGEGLTRDPAIYVANHASHADTAAIIAAIPWRSRRRLAPAAAQDYFFSSRIKGVAVELLTGAFPFPRRGNEGLVRARQLLHAGWSVLLFPEGTRSRDGAVAPFRSGAGELALLGYPVVPVGVAGTRDVMPAGRGIPRRASVALVFGEPVRYGSAGSPARIAGDLERRVRILADIADAARGRPRPWRARIGALARSRRGLTLSFCWGVAEAVFWPIVPDVAVALMALAAPSRFPALALAAVSGSVAGGAVAYGLGAAFGSGMLGHLPLVTERMTTRAYGWLSSQGARGVGNQAWSGVPFKAFGWQAAEQGIGFGGFLAQSALARAPRLFASGLAFAAVGTALDRWMDRIYGVLAIVFFTAFGVGLVRVVASWS